ncbi:PTS sugar transporter subunit IIB [Candidatus Stoquefichus massiliensis]|uniref:PTS sugar transporter subunit IIB n=1 Tax=Candidatus Stoquefichus massiliensis TaxID=1470350 RepID=UPI00048000F7|nr:PTS sugar transporter [Candidatus Stoquefichus massiliensis]
MLKIVLCCSAAMSTSLLVEKINHAAKEENISIEICATGLNDIETVAKNASIILMAPQVQYAKKHIKKMFSQIPVIDVSTRDYGTMNGHSVFALIMQTLSIKQ